ncbi:MAG: hypothetical protein WCO77_10795, partial [bacterium]
MSLCHIWFGVLRSKKRGFEGLRFGFFFTTGINCLACSVRRTVVVLVGRKNIRRSNCEIRLTPNSGFARLTSTIFSWTAVSDPFVRRWDTPLPDRSPSSPRSRYRLTQSNTVPLVTPISFATSP